MSASSDSRQPDSTVTVAHPTHDYSLDLIRIFASFLVILIHTCAIHFYSLAPSSPEWQVFNFYDTLSRSCVPLFFMISGALFLSRKKPIDLPRFFSKNILHLFIIYIVWSFIYAVSIAGLSTLGTPEGFSSFLLSFLHPKYHLWFLPAMIGVYLIAPFLQGAAQHWDGRYVSYFCVIFFLFNILINTFSLLSLVWENHFADITSWLNGFSIPITFSAGYFVLGYFLYHHPFRNVKSYLLIGAYLFVVLLSAYLNLLYGIYKNITSELLYGYTLLPAFCEAFLLFLLFRRIPVNRWSNRTKSAIAFVSKYTLGIYLLHPFVLERLNFNFGIKPLSFNPLFSTPLIALLTFLICLLITFLLKKIPYIGKYIV